MRKRNEWLEMLEDEISDEAHFVLNRKSERYRCFEKEKNDLAKKYPLFTKIIEGDQIRSGGSFSKKELMELSRMIQIEKEQEALRMQKIYWLAWRDCIQMLKRAEMTRGAEISGDESG